MEGWGYVKSTEFFLMRRSQKNRTGLFPQRSLLVATCSWLKNIKRRSLLSFYLGLSQAVYINVYSLRLLSIGAFSMATPNVSGYELIITSGTLVNAIADTSGFRIQIAQIDTFNSDSVSNSALFASGTYYVHNTLGSDAAAGTSGAPFKTLRKVQSVANSLGGRYKFAFARGESWIDPTGLTFYNHLHTAFTDYGNPAAAKPCLSALQTLDAYNLASLTPSGVYRIPLATTSASGKIVEWVVEGSDNSVEFFSPYREFSTSGALHSAGSGSFHWSSGNNILFVKPWLPIDESTILRYTNSSGTAISVIDNIQASGQTTVGSVLIKNLRAQGFGIRREQPDNYIFRVQAPNTEVRMEGNDIYYSKFHNAGQVQAGGTSLLRTRGVFKDNTLGMCLANNTNVSATLLVAYNALGNHECYFIGNRFVGGGVFTAAYVGANSTTNFGSTNYAHTAGGSATIALAVALDNINAVSGNASGGRPCVTPSMFGNLPSISGRHNITSYRGYCINDKNYVETTAASFPNLPNCIYHDSRYYQHLPGQVIFVNHPMLASGGKIGTIFSQSDMTANIKDSTFSVGTTALFSQAGFNGLPDYDHGVTFSKIRFNVDRLPGQNFNFGDLNATGHAAYHGSQLIVENSFFTTTPSGIYLFINIPNKIPNYGDGVYPTGGLFRNAQYGWETANYTDTFAGFVSSVIQNVVVATGQTYVSTSRPLVSNPLYRAASGIPGTTLVHSHDYVRNPRESLYSIGLYEDAPYPTVPNTLAATNNTTRTSTVLTFDDVTPFGVSGYVIERTINGVLTSGFLPYSSGERFVANFGLAGGDFNSYRVATINENGETGPYSSALVVTVPYAEGIQKVHAGGRNDNTAKYSTLRGSVSARHVAKSDLNGDNSKLTDRVTIASGTYRTGAEYNQSVTTTNYQIIAGSGDLGKSAEPLHYRVGINRIKKNI